MGIRRKSDNINKNYPVLGFRVGRAEKDDFLRSFDAAIEILNSMPEYRRVNLKKNAVFLRALELGLEEIKKRKSLG